MDAVYIERAQKFAEEVRMVKTVRARHSRVARNLGLNLGGFETLVLLVNKPEDDPLYNAGDVARINGDYPHQTSRQIRELTGKGYILASISKGDRRKVALSVTDEGRRAYERGVELSEIYRIEEEQLGGINNIP